MCVTVLVMFTCAAMQGFNHHVEEDARMLIEYTSRAHAWFDESTKLVDRSDQRRQFYNRSDSIGVETVGVETDCMRQMHLVTEEIQDQLKQTVFPDNPHTTTSTSSSLGGGPLWDRLEQLRKSYCPVELALALNTNIRQSAGQIAQQINSLDLKRDALHLKFKVQKDGQYSDDFDSVHANHSVDSLLKDGQRQHVARHMETLAEKNTATKWQGQFNHLKADLRRQLQHQCGSSDEIFQAAISDVKLRCQITALRTSTGVLHEESERIENLIQSRERRMHQLKQKHQRIQHFRNIMDDKNAIIQNLLREHARTLDDVGIAAAEVSPHRCAVPYGLDSRVFATLLTKAWWLTCDDHHTGTTSILGQ